MQLLRLALASAVLAVAAAIGDDGVLALTEKTFSTYVGKPGKVALVEFYAPWCGHCKNLAPAYAQLSETFKGVDSVVIAKVDATENGELASKFGVQGYPTIKFFPAGSSTPEDYEGGRDVDDLVAFINSKAGTNKKVKSTPSAVPALEPSTFDAVVGDPTKHKLVEFYAPWCGHCKNLAPVWEKLGSIFEGESNVVVAKVDADKHRELGERFGVKGFPTIKYIPAGAGKPDDLVEDYNGGRSLADFVSFVNSKAGTARDTSGGLLATAGRVASFDKFAATFIAGDAATQKATLAEAVAAAKALTGSDAAAADRYVKVMQKVVEKGVSYIAKEAARVEGMLGSEAVKKEKKTELALKKNVLGAFKAGAAEEAEL